MPKLVHITTVPESLDFVEGQIGFMQRSGFDVSVITSPGAKLDAFVERTGVCAFELPMARAITPREDQRAFLALVDRLLDLAPDIVHAHTPKGGLLGMMAAKIALVPARLYHMRGLLTFTATGVRRQLYKMAERTSCELATHVVAQSHSLREIAIQQRLVPREKISVFLGGSNGVDSAERFNPSQPFPNVRKDLKIPKRVPVVGFVGRLVKDKGIEELGVAWQAIKKAYANPHLILVGPIEQRDAISDETIRSFKEDPSVHLIGYTRETAKYYAVMDVLVLPSYREGFPNVPLEAAAMGKPVIATDVPGCVDAVDNGKTGTLIPPQDSVALADAIRMYLDDAALRKRHGDAGRNRVMLDFIPERIWEANLDLYSSMMKNNARRH